jgi:Ca2+-binding EF-hand superfamily protein
MFFTFEEFSLISSTGLITAGDLRQALDTLGITFGTKMADKILVSMRFTQDGFVDYLKLGEEVEQFMRFVFVSSNAL